MTNIGRGAKVPQGWPSRSGDAHARMSQLPLHSWSRPYALFLE
jgi:hypothetical protein